MLFSDLFFDYLLLDSWEEANIHLAWVILGEVEGREHHYVLFYGGELGGRKGVPVA